MKEWIKTLLGGTLFCLVLWSSGMVASVTQGLQPTMSTAVEDGVELPVLMYHQVLKDPAQAGEFVITAQQFEEDLQWLLENDYQTVSTKQLLDYTQGQSDLPDNPILLTFDDGNETFYEYVYPLLQQYQAKAVLSIIGKYTDLFTYNEDHHLSYSHATWDQLKTMQDSGLVEVGNHTYDLHQNEGTQKGILPREGEPINEYQTRVTADIASLNQLMEEHLGTAPSIFCYPFGARDQQADAVLQSFNFSVLLGCEAKSNCLQVGDTLPMRLGRYNRTADCRLSALLS